MWKELKELCYRLELFVKRPLGFWLTFNTENFESKPCPKYPVSTFSIWLC
jgi:hypothetical protein